MSNNIGMNFEGPKPEGLRELGVQIINILNIRAGDAVLVKALDTLGKGASIVVQNCTVTTPSHKAF